MAFGLLPIRSFSVQSSHPRINICQQRVDTPQTGILFGSHSLRQVLMCRQTQSNFSTTYRFLQYILHGTLSHDIDRFRRGSHRGFPPFLGKGKIGKSLCKISLCYPIISPFFRNIFKPITVLFQHINEIYQRIITGPSFHILVTIKIKYIQLLIPLSSPRIITKQPDIPECFRIRRSIQSLFITKNRDQHFFQIALTFEIIQISHRFLRLDIQPVRTGETWQ